MCNSCLRRWISHPLSYLIHFLRAIIRERDALWGGKFLNRWLSNALPTLDLLSGESEHKRETLDTASFVQLCPKHCCVINTVLPLSHNFEAALCGLQWRTNPVHLHFTKLSLLSNTGLETKHKIFFSYTTVINLSSFLSTELIDCKFLAGVKKAEA